MKRQAPAAARNRAPIAAVLAEELPQQGLVLEIASGTGEHAVRFAGDFPRLEWQPSDQDAEALASIDAWGQEADLPNLLPAILVDASSPRWPIRSAEAVLCINMVHISPWRATVGLFAGAANLLDQGAPLILYGPYFETDVETAPSNIAFDESLRRRNAEWGIRRLDQIDEIATSSGFQRSRRVAMPANNLMLVYRRN